VEKTAYSGLHTFQREPLINDIMQAVNDSEIVERAKPITEVSLIGSEEEEEE